MLRHVVLFRWNDELPDGHVDAVSAALDQLPSAIPEIIGYRHGADVGANAGTWDFAVVGDFASVEDHAVYRDHPAHQAFVQQYILPHAADRAAVQFAIDGDGN